MRGKRKGNLGEVGKRKQRMEGQGGERGDDCIKITFHLNSAATTCRNGDLRLVEGATTMTGRLEFCNNNAWGTVCDDFWDNNDAQVACRQLGFSATGVWDYISLNVHVVESADRRSP